MAPHRLLVVDDEQPILFALREYFTLRGYEVDCAKEVAEADALLERRTYAVVIVDLRLSSADGTEGLGLIQRARARCPKTSILLLTAYGSPATEREALQCGADQVLHKPVPLSHIAGAVAGILEPARCANAAVRA
jgi:DNA-binding response OmpR family regulator